MNLSPVTNVASSSAFNAFFRDIFSRSNLLLSLLISFSSLQGFAQAKDTKEATAADASTSVTSEVDEQGTRVYVCNIYFPLNSVSFTEQDAEVCFRGIKVDKVTYIHVIATATIDGTNEHNFYLSNRRAGAIEAHLNRRFPDIQVHAYGGGENPRFGKAARIIIVESGDNPDADKPGLSKALIKIPPPRVEYKTVVKTEIKEKLVPKPKLGYIGQVRFGMAKFKPLDAEYQVIGLQVSRVWDFLPALELGVHYEMLRSNQEADIHSGGINAARVFPLMKFGELSRLEGGVSLQLDYRRVDGEEFDYGAGLLLNYWHDELGLVLSAGRSADLLWQGTLGIGTKL